MSVQLLDKTRRIGKLLHNNNSSKVVFNDICSVLTETLASNAVVVSRKGKVLGESLQTEDGKERRLIETTVGDFIDADLNERFLSILSTNENLNLSTLGFSEENVFHIKAILSPINIAGQRYGTLFVYRRGDIYDIDDIILCEYSTTVVGLEMMRSEHEENAESVRKKQVVKSAIATLTYSEQEAIVHIFDALDGMEGMLVTSKIADAAGITRSVIVNALRKFESAGVIESRSSGMKGTFIRVRNEVVFEEIADLKNDR